MGTITHNVKLTDADIKKTAVSALEFCLEQTLKQFEIKHKVAITGIKLTVGYSADSIAVCSCNGRKLARAYARTRK